MDDEKGRSLQERAEVRLRKGQYDRAIGDLDEAIRLGVGNADVFYDRADAWIGHGNLASALCDMNEGIRLDPRNAAAYTTRGFIHSESRKLDLALADFNRAIEIDPRHAEAFHHRGVYRIDRDQYDEALADLNEAIRLDPRSAASFLNRGYVHAVRHELDEALADYGEAIRLDPANPDAYAYRGSAWYQKQEFDKALADQTEAIRRNPRRGDVYFARGATRAVKQDFDRAIVDFSQAIEIDPDHPGPRLYRGVTYLTWKGEPGKALRDFTAVIHLDPGSADAFSARGSPGRSSRHMPWRWPTTTRPSGSIPTSGPFSSTAPDPRQLPRLTFSRRLARRRIRPQGLRADRLERPLVPRRPRRGPRRVARLHDCRDVAGEGPETDGARLSRPAEAGAAARALSGDEALPWRRLRRAHRHHIGNKVGQPFQPDARAVSGWKARPT